MPENKTDSKRHSFRFLPLSLHIETLGGIAAPLVLRGSPLPATRSEVFGTAEDNQSVVEIRIFLGESPLAKNNHPLGSFRLEGIPPAPKGETKVRVKFIVDRFCSVAVTASVDETDLRVTGEALDPQPFLTKEAIEQALVRAEEDKESDQERVREIEARNSADAAIAKADRRLAAAAENGLPVPQEVSERLAALGIAMESGLIESIRLATQELNAALDPLAASVFGSGSSSFADIFGAAPWPGGWAVSAQKESPGVSTKGKSKVTNPNESRASNATPSVKAPNLGKIFGGGSFALDSSLCFVLMPFDNKFQAFYDDHIRRVVVDEGVSCQRADEISSTKLITWDIWESVNKARFIIADLTDRNANVFYEVGLAHAISKDVILLTRSMGDIPFDLQALRFIVYDYSPRGMVEFEKKLRAAIASVMRGG